MKEGWEYKKLGEVGKVLTGSTPSTKDPENYDSHDYCFVKPSDIPNNGTSVLVSTEFYISKKAFSCSRKLPKGSVLTTCIGIIGKVGILDIEATCNQQINAIIPFPNIILSSFLAYSILSKRSFLEKKANAPVVPIINKKEFSNTIIGVPPLSEQQRIVEELDLLSSIIEKKKAQLKELDSLAQSIFYDMFGDPVTNEKGWEVKKIGELASVKTGPFGSMLHKEDYISNGIPLVNPIHIKGFHIVADMDFTISNEKAEELNKYILQKGDVIFARRGDIGRCAVVSEKENGYLCGTGSLFVRFEVEVASTFIMYIIRSSSFTNELISNAKGTTMLNLNSSIIENLWLPLPPLPLQQQFAEKIEAIEHQKELIKQSIKEVETLFNSRMDYYFN